MPEYTDFSGAKSPLNGKTASTYGVPFFLDLDTDGDYDLLLG